METSARDRWLLARLVLCAVALLSLFVVVAVRAYHVQVDEGPRLREMAEQQYLKRVELPPRRGTIFDRHKAPMAVSVDVDSVYVNPRVLKDPDDAARRLGAALDVDPKSLHKRFHSRKYFAWVKRRATARQATAVRALKIKGVGMTKESRRFYPNKGLGGLVVGFSGMEGKGLAGLELSYDSLLKGSAQRVVGLRDALGRSVLAEGFQQAATRGNDIVLTLDKFIQYEVEQALQAAYPGVHPERGWVGAVVMDPHNGDVLAMASEPSFDPNRYAKAEVSARRNRTVTDAFEPGSVIKVFAAAGAIDQGAISADDELFCENGAYRVGRHVIHDTSPHGKMSIEQILVKSSNIGISKIAFKLGKAGLNQALRAFGFGQRTGAQVPGERAGVVRDARRLSDVGLANVAFGQGMTATVIQLARAMSAIANGGWLVRPRLVLKVDGPDGREVQTFPPERRRAVRPAVADRVRQMLAGVTQPGGTAKAAALEHYTTAGKTGTAQKVDPVAGGYSRDLWVSSFVGMAPASRPRLVIAVLVNEPATKVYHGYHGGTVAGPIFKRIAGKALRYLGVAPDREAVARAPKSKASITTPALALADDVPPPKAPPLPDVIDTPTVDDKQVPDFTGLSMAEALDAARQAGLSVRFSGSGVAAAQTPGPGPAPARTVCRVDFRPPG